jgi:hypothetical protein
MLKQVLMGVTALAGVALAGVALASPDAGAAERARAECEEGKLYTCLVDGYVCANENYCFYKGRYLGMSESSKNDAKKLAIKDCYAEGNSFCEKFRCDTTR